jgi:kinesin family protein 4/21/27
LQISVGSHRFTYDNVYGSAGGDNAVDLYPDCVQPLVDGLFKGYNATVFAYGRIAAPEAYMQTQQQHVRSRET